MTSGNNDDEFFDHDAGRLPEGAGVIFALGLGLVFWAGVFCGWLVFGS